MTITNGEKSGKVPQAGRHIELELRSIVRSVRSAVSPRAAHICRAGDTGTALAPSDTSHIYCAFACPS